jgi:hypothetical protein
LIAVRDRGRAVAARRGHSFECAGREFERRWNQVAATRRKEVVEALIAPLSIILVFALLAAPSVWFAKRRGRSMVIWGALGMVLPLVSVLLLALLGEKKDAAAY